MACVVGDTEGMGFGGSKDGEHVAHTVDRVFGGSHTVDVVAGAGPQAKGCIAGVDMVACLVGSLVVVASALVAFVFEVEPLLVVEDV